LSGFSTGASFWLDQFHPTLARRTATAPVVSRDLEQIADRGLILGNPVVIAH
jgi:hypothetical protein